MAAVMVEAMAEVMGGMVDMATAMVASRVVGVGVVGAGHTMAMDGRTMATG